MEKHGLASTGLIALLIATAGCQARDAPAHPSGTTSSKTVTPTATAPATTKPAPVTTRPYVDCSGTFSSGSGMAGSSTEKDGKPICFFKADSEAEARVKKACGQNAVCQVFALTRMEEDRQIVATVLSVTRLSGPAGDESPGAAAGPPPFVDASACPSHEFKVFAEAFSSRISLQAHFTRWPLETTTIDASAKPEPKPVTKRVAERDMSFPIMMEIGRARREGKVVRIGEDNDTSAHVEYAGSNSGERVRYLFKRAGSCWQMVGIDNRSL